MRIRFCCIDHRTGASNDRNPAATLSNALQLDDNLLLHSSSLLFLAGVMRSSFLGGLRFAFGTATCHEDKVRDKKIEVEGRAPP